MRPLAVVKVGGSLRADPARLSGLLAALADGVHGRCVIVPGGGAFADAVREAQRRDGFDDSVAHRLALDAMGRMAKVFHAIEPRLSLRSVVPAALSPLRGRVALASARVGRGERPFRTTRSPHPTRFAGPPLPHRGEGKARSLAQHETVVWDPALLKAGHPDIAETWDVTSDSLALWLARGIGAARCVLVKSADAPSGRSPADLARLGLVDAAFPAFAARFAGCIELWGPAGIATLPDRIAA
ncbi:uridylate kinase [uncultured Methylobacterium sp.]|uniref:amino acid kinase family protein n=1 Tax=uncultured Methylobacterium sp. TaxID=157278 RepID=UPI0035CB7D76